jgi:hypothetical protein
MLSIKDLWDGSRDFSKGVSTLILVLKGDPLLILVLKGGGVPL